MKRWCFAYGLKMFIVCLVFAMVLSLGVMLLWNWLIPQIFRGPEINLWQALGILALTRILVGFGGWKRGCNHSYGEGKGQWKKKWEERLAGLSPEEREKIKEKYKKCCGPWEGKYEEPHN